MNASVLLVLLAALIPMQAPASASQSTDFIPTNPEQNVAPELARELEGLDPATDGWQEEVLLPELKSQAKGMAAHVRACLLNTQLDSLNAWSLSSDFEMGASFFASANLESAGEATFFRIGTTGSEPGSEAPDTRTIAEGLANWNSWLPLESVREVQVEFSAVDIELSETTTTSRNLRVRWRVEVYGQDSVARGFQRKGLWESTGSLEAENQIRWKSLELVQAQGSSFPELWFQDASEVLLSEAPEFREGLSFWQERIDSGLGVSFMGHVGLAVADVDQDGWQDLLALAPGGLPNRLFLGAPKFKGKECARAAGLDFLDLSPSALFADFDNDGDPDLAQILGSELVFLENDGTGHFTVRSRFEAPLATSLACADVDLDADLDVFVCGYENPYQDQSAPTPYFNANNGQANQLYLCSWSSSSKDANGRAEAWDWSFKEQAEARGLGAPQKRFSFAASFEDFDRDGDVDLYVANDFGANQLYRNEAGHFTDVAAELGVSDVAAGMGVSWGDANSDGRMDLFVSNMDSKAGQRTTTTRDFGRGLEASAGDSEPSDQQALFERHARGNSLFLQQADGSFIEVGDSAGVREGRWAWGGLFVDCDNDGRQDLVIPNGFVTGPEEDDL